MKQRAAAARRSKGRTTQRTTSFYREDLGQPECLGCNDEGCLTCDQNDRPLIDEDDEDEDV